MHQECFCVSSRFQDMKNLCADVSTQKVCVELHFFFLDFFCLFVLFRAHYQFVADLSLLGANEQMFGQCLLSKTLSGICKDKQRQQLTLNNTSMI